MIVFGLAEVVTGFTHSFFGIVAGDTIAATYAGVIIGTLYAGSGLLVLTMRKWAAALAIVFLGSRLIKSTTRWRRPDRSMRGSFVQSDRIAWRYV